jgi:predicted DNA-binding antitoxin AbrB/MazE fold protein
MYHREDIDKSSTREYGDYCVETALAIQKGSGAMTRTIRARVNHGILEPLEAIDVPDGTEVTVTIVDVLSDEDFDAFRRSAGGWAGSIDAEALIGNIYADRELATRPEPRL